MTYAIVLESDDTIAHFGIKRRSGRYPWGSGQRPYQSGQPSTTPRKETPEQREARKKEVLRTSRSAIAISEFADELTYKELDDALKRIDLNKKLDEAVRKEKELGVRKIDEAMKKVGKINDWTKTGISSIKNVNDVLELFNTIKISAKGGNYNEYKRYLQEQERLRQQD